ncbi:MAG: class I SAM-dependent methyltransferase [Deltaproteobacteria bacterium]|nr:class I SAM-dependent methyltransferase [Deltaproteobacteria bacterium]
MSKLQGVADTLFIPLAARIYVSKRFPEYFFDERAMSLEKEIPTESIQKNSSEYFYMASVARYYNLDLMTKNFLSTHKKCNVVNIGAGLETAYFRLNSQNAVFYEVDLPEVIEIRRMALGEEPRDVLIGGDMFALDWMRSIDNSLPSLFVVSGVFQYYHEKEIIKFIQDIKQAFAYGELIFDATNEKGVKYANKYVKKTGNTSAPMHFFINDCERFAQKTGAALMECRPFFIDARKILAKKLKIYTRIVMKFVDMSSRAILIQLKL